MPATAIASPPDLKARLARYRWYHQIEVADGIKTPTDHPSQGQWPKMLEQLGKIDLRGRRVLDVGCRDGLFSFEAEKLGASEIIGIDNNLSRGATELLIPMLNSKVQMREMNLYQVNPDTMGKFDVICFFGVLYHLRFPNLGLKTLVDCLADDGIILIETAVLADPRFEGLELMYCPFERTPYNDLSCCTFFNRAGLEAAMRSFKCRLNSCHNLFPQKPRPPRRERWRRRIRQWKCFLKGRSDLVDADRNELLDVIERHFFVFQKDSKIEHEPWLKDYWEQCHKQHTFLPSTPTASRKTGQEPKWRAGQFVAGANRE